VQSIAQGASSHQLLMHTEPVYQLLTGSIGDHTFILFSASPPKRSTNYPQVKEKG
jgi:hypothetical protein